MATTLAKLATKHLTKPLRNALRLAGSKKRNAEIIVVHDAVAFTITTHNTQYDGGTRNQYRGWKLGSDALTGTIWEHDGALIGFHTAGCVVVISDFCGSQCMPTIYVRECDLPAFLGCSLPSEHADMPASIAADWMDERAGELTGREAHKWRTGAALVRQILGLTPATV
jgi:hypothetical protein